MKVSTIGLVAVLAFPGVGAAPPGGCGVGRTVKTDSGPVQGHPASGAPLVSEYLGIPYAQPPVGDLRFQPPVAFEGSSVINGSNFVSQSRGGQVDGETADFLIGVFLLPAQDHRCQPRHHHQAGHPCIGRAGASGTELPWATERGLLDPECLDQEADRRGGEASAGLGPWWLFRFR
jgi:carboxylesterase family protein